jgi:hypothetical protein
VVCPNGNIDDLRRLLSEDRNGHKRSSSTRTPTAAQLLIDVSSAGTCARWAAEEDVQPPTVGTGLLFIADRGV